MKQFQPMSSIDKERLYYGYNTLDSHGVECAKEDKMQTLPNDISEMTARDMKIYCLEWRVTHNCAKEVCELHKRHVCGESPHKWEPKRCVLTPQEIAICKALGAKYVSMDKNYHGGVVELWKLKPTADDYEDYGYTSDGLEIDGLIASVSSKAFTSIKPGDCICVEEYTQSPN